MIVDIVSGVMGVWVCGGIDGIVMVQNEMGQILSVTGIFAVDGRAREMLVAEGGESPGCGWSDGV